MGIFDDVQRSSEGKGETAGPVSGFTPTAGYNSPAAALIEGVEGAAKLGNKIYKDNVTKEFIEDLSGAERAIVGGVKKKLDTLNKALVSDKRTRITAAEWRAQTERILKTAINAHPSVGAELRKAAADHLGFNPIGEAVRQQASAERSSAAKEGVLRKRVLNMMADYGLVDLSLTDSENISASGALAINVTKSRDEAAQVQQVATQAGVWDVKNQGKAANQYVGKASARITAELQKIVNSEASPEEKRLAINNLKVDEGSFLSQTFPDLSVGTLESLRETYKGSFDLANGVVDGSASLKDMENSMKSRMLLASAGVLNQKGATELVALLDLAKGQPVPPSIMVKFAKLLQEAGNSNPSDASNLEVSLARQTGNQSPYDSIDGLGLGKEGTAEWHKAVTNYNTTFAKNADPKNSVHVTHFENIIKGTLVKRFNNMSPSERDGILKVASSPKFVDFMKEIDDTELTERVRDLTARHMTTLTQDFFKEAFEQADGSPDEGDSNSSFTLLERFLGSDRRKLVRLEPQPDGSVMFKPTAGLQGAKLAAANEVTPGLNGGYAVRINDAIKTFAHVQGHTNYKAMRDIVLLGMPEFKFFMDEDEEKVITVDIQDTDNTDIVDFRDLP